MSAWRREAAARLPELWVDHFVRDSPYTFFAFLLEFVRRAHDASDDDRLARAYGFARWCFGQGGDLWNAAGVSFYEHLFDDWRYQPQVVGRLDARVVADCWPLWEARLSPVQLEVLQAALSRGQRSEQG